MVAIFEVDGLHERGIADRLNIKAIPSLLVYISGIEFRALIGFHHMDELQKRLWSIIPDR